MSQTSYTWSKKWVTKMMPTPLALKSFISPNSFSTSDSSKEEVGSSKISTLQSISTALAMATICWTAMEQSESCWFAFAGIPRFSRIRSASAFIFLHLVSLDFPRPIYIFSATVRLGHRVIS